ncbi:sugar phosphate isomerase/epimerase [bacterium]|nr:sugar phosphate isomerase/epimerase [bacterium]
MKFSVCSLILPDYPAEKAAHLVKEEGFSGVEWTVGYKKALWNPDKEWHISLKNLEDNIPRIKEIIEKEKLNVPSLGSLPAMDDFKTIERLFKAASILNCPCVRIGEVLYEGDIDYNDLLKKTIRDYETIEKMANDYNVKGVMETHNHTIVPSANSIYRILSNFDPNYVGAIFDPGCMVIEGKENWKMAIEILGNYLAHVHIKNLGWFYDKEKGWGSRLTKLDEGLVDWKEIIKLLKDKGYQGYLSLEDFRNGYCCKPEGISNQEKLREDMEFLRKCE